MKPAVPGKLAGEQLAERISGEPAEEPRPMPETGNRPGGIERAAARAGGDSTQRPDDKVDEALARDQDHLSPPAISSPGTAPVMIATASSMEWLCGVITPAQRP